MPDMALGVMLLDPPALSLTCRPWTVPPQWWLCLVENTQERASLPLHCLDLSFHPLQSCVPLASHFMPGVSVFPLIIALFLRESD